MAISFASNPSLITVIPIGDLEKYLDTLVDNLKTILQVAEQGVLNINVISINVGSFVCKADLENPSSPYPRNHECTVFVNNLLTNPSSQLSPAFLEFMRQQNIHTLNINQYMFLIDPMYSRKEYSLPIGLVKMYPSVIENPIISTNGLIVHDELLPAPIKYNSFLQPHIIPHDINEEQIISAIEKFQSIPFLLINLMDCTSNTLMRLWMQNNAPNVYLAMPNCLAIDDRPMYKPIITFDSELKCRWINWTLDIDSISLYQLISPHTYEFLIHNYKRHILEVFFLPICKFLERLRVSLEYNFKGGKLVFNGMSLQQFRILWTEEHIHFAPLFLSYLGQYYRWNYYKFIDILLKDANNTDLSLQEILLKYLKIHLKQLKIFFPGDPIPDYIDNAKEIQSLIYHYLDINGVH